MSEGQEAQQQEVSPEQPIQQEPDQPDQREQAPSPEPIPDDGPVGDMQQEMDPDMGGMEG